MLNSIKVKNTLRSAQLIVVWANFIVVFLLVLGSSLSAAPVLNESILNAGTAGVTVGRFDGGGAGLRVIGDLTNTSSPNRNFVSQTFTPSVT